MLIQILFFFFLFFLLFFICRKITSFLYALVFLLSENEKLSLWVLVVVFLPGTLIHEVSHLILATILRVPTGRLSIMPIVEKKGPSFAPLSGATADKEVKTGTLAIAKSDPFRYTLIGLAPIIIGLFCIYLIGRFILPQATTSFFLLFIVYCLLFIVSSTMFSSKKDLDSLIIVAPIIFLFFTSLYLVGVRISLTGLLLQKAAWFISSLNYFLLITNIIDFMALLFLAANLTFWQKVLGKRIKQ